jgi:hypothetical protein
MSRMTHAGAAVLWESAKKQGSLLSRVGPGQETPLLQGRASRRECRPANLLARGLAPLMRGRVRA